MESERLLFRRYTWDDFEFVASLCADSNVMRFIGEGRAWTREETKQRFEVWLSKYESEHATGLLLAIRKSDRCFIGHAGLIPQTIEGVDETGLGYWIAPTYWGQGFATEAAAFFRDYGFNQLGQQRLVSIIQFDNLASIGVAKKVGMSFERNIEFKSKRVALYAMNKLGLSKQ